MMLSLTRECNGEPRFKFELALCTMDSSFEYSPLTRNSNWRVNKDIHYNKFSVNFYSANLISLGIGSKRTTDHI